MRDLDGFKDKVTWMSWYNHCLSQFKLVYRNSTYENYSHMLMKWFNPKWNDKFLDEITPSDVHSIVFNPEADISSWTRRTLLKIVKRVFNMAIEDGILVKNPAIGLKIKIVETNQSVLNKNEVDILLREAHAKQHRFLPHWILALLTGVRSGELYSLRWKDVDFVNNKININKSWTKFNGEGPTKTAKNRVCPMSKECRLFLEELKLKSNGCEHVLPRLWEWDQGQQAQILKSFCSEIGIQPVKFHDLRATFITQMLNNGVALSKVMAIVGHSSLKTTQGYLRLSGKDVEGATESLNIIVPREQTFDNVINLKK